MNRGFDTTGNTSAQAAAIKAAGYAFVGRYYFSGVSHVKLKLTRAEAVALSAAGLFVVAVFENAADHAGYFSHSQGLADGRAAFRYARDEIGQPADSAIYFTIDYDASEQEIARLIVPYFQGIAEGFAAEAQGGPSYGVGVYGSGRVCRSLAKAALASHTWLAQSRGWSESAGYTDWQIKQGPSGTFGGLAIDTDVSAGSGGGFQIAR